MNRYLFKFTTGYLIIAVSIIVTVLIAAPAHASEVESEASYTNEDCIECHRTGSQEGGVYISIDDFNASVHAEEASCQECHTMVLDDDHQTTPGSGAVDCSSCHEQEIRHGKGSHSGTRPRCYSCDPGPE